MKLFRPKLYSEESSTVFYSVYSICAHGSVGESLHVCFGLFFSWSVAYFFVYGSGDIEHFVPDIPETMSD